MPIHNEAKHLPVSLRGLKAIPQINGQSIRLIAVLDRCTDSSEAIVKKYFPDALVIKKDTVKWKNSYAENLQLGFQHSTSAVVCILDADILVFYQSFVRLLDGSRDNASVGGNVLVDKNAGFLSLMYHFWEKTFDLAFEREPWGGFRAIRREALAHIGGFKDVLAPDTQLDIDLRRAGYTVKFVREAYCYHLRKVTLEKCVQGQVQSGRMRRYMKTSFPRVLAHSVIRLRPFVVYGYLKS
jgi:cellulose synthase/poly-beta-1,6-N-acetylglucosamine synthase-like glycosyltransferase